MAKLNQYVAIEKGEKAKAQKGLTELHRESQKTVLTTGISRSYKPKNDEGDELPSESTLVQVNAEDILDRVTHTLSELFDVVATKEATNAKASADVVVDGKTIVKNAPVTYLLFLEKQLTDLHTFVAKLPVLDPAENWTKDASNGVWRTDVTQTVRTKKVPKTFLKAEATERHPAQVEIFHEDVIVGTWSTTKFSGALERTRVNTLIERVEALQIAVKFAREEANNTDVVETKAATAVFRYLFEK